MPIPVDNEWSRKDAAKAFDDVLNAAKTGQAQKVVDFDGTFEIKFIRAKTGMTANEFMAHGGPLEE